MIFLLGGASETATLATALVEAGYRVLIYTAADVVLDVGNLTILDAIHPYATLVQTDGSKRRRAFGYSLF